MIEPFKPLQVLYSKMMVVLLTGLCYASLSFATTDCDTCASPSLPSVEGHWILSKWQRPTSATTEPTERAIINGLSAGLISIQFDSEKKAVSGYAGCNRFFSALSLDENSRIKFGPIATTRMFCSEASRMALELAFVKQLSNYRELKQKEDVLYLIGSSGDVLQFIRR